MALWNRHSAVGAPAQHLPLCFILLLLLGLSAATPTTPAGLLLQGQEGAEATTQEPLAKEGRGHRAPLRLPSAHADNDVLAHNRPPTHPLASPNSSTHIEAHEEASNRIADPTFKLPSAPAFAPVTTLAPATAIVPASAPAPAFVPAPAPAIVPAPAPSNVPAPAPAIVSTHAPAIVPTSAPAPAIVPAPAPAIVPASSPAPAFFPAPSPAIVLAPAPASTNAPTPSITSIIVPITNSIPAINGNPDSAITPITVSVTNSTSAAAPADRTTERHPQSPPLPPPTASFNNRSEQLEQLGEDAHPCARECVESAPPLHCYYYFEVSGYSSMSKACYDCPFNAADCSLPHCTPGDGTRRGLVVVNRRLPGPAVVVCQGDRVVVDLHNAMHAQTTSVHWHGQQQRGTPYADGVPHVTQCPVPPLTTFRYAFNAEQPGTHFWHSHSGQQRADGVFGALLVRRPRQQDPHAPLYDRDLLQHVIVLADWGAAVGEERFLAHYHAGGTNKPSALLINGRARVPPSGAHPDPSRPPVPAPEFLVRRGLRYRFRIINAGFLNCPVELSVDGHRLLVIATDGNDLQPVAADSLVSYAGERWDVVLEANASSAGEGVHWIRARGLLDCDERFTSVHQVAVLRYEDAAAPGAEPSAPFSYDAARRGGHQVNSLNVGTGTPGVTTAAELQTLAPDDDSLKEQPDFRFYVAYDFYALDNPHFHQAPHYGFHNVSSNALRTYTPQFNHISMRLPAAPLLPQREEIDEAALCNASSLARAGRSCERSYCECAHVLRVPLGAVVELVLVDEGVTYEANHPFHLHGHAFRVVAMRRLGNSTSLQEVQRLDAAGLLPRSLQGAALKDTVTVPDGGYTVLRLHADNPGYWLFHCHMEFHVEVGMALVLKVGEHHQFPPVPKGFPRCGDWIPDDDGEDEEEGEGYAPPDEAKSGAEEPGEEEDVYEHRTTRAATVAPTPAPVPAPVPAPAPAAAPAVAPALLLLLPTLLLLQWGERAP